MQMTEESAVALLDAFVRYAYNAEFDEFKKLFPDATTDYQLEKYKRMQRNLGAFFGDLDTHYRKRLVDLIVIRYFKKEGKMLAIIDESDDE